MSWVGTWRNQYGSTVEIASDDGGRITGVFRTALSDSGFHGIDAPVVGLAQGDCIAFVSTAVGPAGAMAVSYTGLLRDGKLETLWHYVGDEALVAPAVGEPAERKKQKWWKATLTSADTFERIG